MMIIVKKRENTHIQTKFYWLIAIDLCKVNYQTLLIIYLKLTKKNVFSKIIYEHAQKVWEVFEIKNLGE